MGGSGCRRSRSSRRPAPSSRRSELPAGLNGSGDVARLPVVVPSLAAILGDPGGRRRPPKRVFEALYRGRGPTHLWSAFPIPFNRSTSDHCLNGTIPPPLSRLREFATNTVAMHQIPLQVCCPNRFAENNQKRGLKSPSVRGSTQPFGQFRPAMYRIRRRARTARQARPGRGPGELTVQPVESTQIARSEPLLRGAGLLSARHRPLGRV